MFSLLKPWWSVVLLTAVLTGCAGSHYTDYEDSQRAFAKAEALAKAGKHATAAQAYEKLSAPSKPYALETYYLQAWSGAAKSWEAAGDETRALAAYQRQSALARQYFPLKPNDWPWSIASADIELARFQANREPEQAKALLQQLLTWANAMPSPGQQSAYSAIMLGKSLLDSAEVFEQLKEPQQALLAAMLALEKDDGHAQAALYYDLPIRVARQLKLDELAAQLSARQQAVNTVTAMTENGQLPNPPYRKVGNRYEGTNYSHSQTATYYTARAQAYRQLGQEQLAQGDDRNAARYQRWAADEQQREAEAQASASYESDSGGSMAGALLGGLMQGAGMVMQQQSGYGSESAAQGLMLQSVGAAVAGDQQTLDQMTRQSLNNASYQQAAQGNAAGALATQLAASAYTPTGSATAPVGGYGTQAAAAATNGCSDQLLYASGQAASFSAAAAQFTPAELQTSFALFQQCMNDGVGECYMFFRNGEPADYPLAALRGMANDPNDLNASTFRCHAAAGFGAGQ